LHCLLDGKPYLVGPLARLNINHDRLTGGILEILAGTGIRFPSRNMFHSVVARAVEIHYALHEAIRVLQAYRRPESASAPLAVKSGVGMACTEAPRGILWHRYELADNGEVTNARIVPPTSQNQARIEEDLCASIYDFGLDQPEERLRLHCETVIRNYDPCISCSTHFLDLTVRRD
jgi:coenzyme F420-reducing hydrogenase alpha subunit